MIIAGRMNPLSPEGAGGVTGVCELSPDGVTDAPSTARITVSLADFASAVPGIVTTSFLRDASFITEIIVDDPLSV